MPISFVTVAPNIEQTAGRATASRVSGGVFIARTFSARLGGRAVAPDTDVQRSMFVECRSVQKRNAPEDRGLVFMVDLANFAPRCPDRSAGCSTRRRRRPGGNSWLTRDVTLAMLIVGAR
jgi:hypothetical protein